MRICLVGSPSSGKSTVFQALSGADPTPTGERSKPRVCAVDVPDDRVRTLSELYHPKKTTYAAVEYVDLAGMERPKSGGGELGTAFLNAVRPAAVLVHVIDGFSVPELADEMAVEQVETLDTELALSDLDLCERRLARLRKTGPKKAGAEAEEMRALEAAVDYLGEGKPLRTCPELAGAPELRGYQLLSSKPVITVINTAEDAPAWSPAALPVSLRHAREGAWGRFVALCATLECEIASLPHEDAVAFLADYGIDQPARERVVRLSYELLGLSCFYTVGDDEVRAWTIRAAASAREAARAIHTDIARGFIRAEVVDYDTVVHHGSFEEAKKRGAMRSRGRDYEMAEGDVVSFQFNV